jgi:hypothetical protein
VTLMVVPRGKRLGITTSKPLELISPVCPSSGPALGRPFHRTCAGSLSGYRFPWRRSIIDATHLHPSTRLAHFLASCQQRYRNGIISNDT